MNIENNELTVTARRAPGTDGDNVVAAERPTGTFTRQMILSDALDADGLEANLDNGVLTVTIPVSERSRQRKIEVTGGQHASRAIDASSSDASTDDER